MTRTFKTLAATFVFAASASTAFAGTQTFEASITYDNTVSASENYALIKKSASTACKKEAIRAGFDRREIKGSVINKCQRQLIKQAVKHIDQDALATYHAAKTGQSGSVKLASTR